MAIWQFDLQCVPRSGVVDIYRKVPSTLTEEDLERDDWWQHVAIDRAQELLDNFLQKKVTWSPKIAQWGQDDGDRVDLFIEDDILKGILVRFDARRHDIIFIEAISMFMKDLDLLAVDSSKSCFFPGVDILWNMVESSDSFRFTQNPEKFLRHLQAGKP